MFAKLLFNQARRKWALTGMICLAMTALVTLYVYSINSEKFNNRSMQLIMKNMGHNLLILPRTADPSRVHLCAEGQTLFPESVTDAMAERLELKSKYYVAVLQERVQRGERTILVTGIRPVARPDETREKGNLIDPVEPGTARLGASAARILGAEPGDEIAFSGGTFRVSKVLPPKGTTNDYRAYLNLEDAQEMLGRPDKINAIWSFMCMHGMSLPDIRAEQDRVMEKHFPEYTTITAMNIAHARDIARRTTSGYLANFVTLVAVITMLVIAVTGVQEVTERRQELGVLLAMGSGYAYIAALYVCKILILAAVASVVGFLVGSYLSTDLLGGLLVVNTRQVGFLWSQLPDVLAKMCAVAVLAAAAPVVKMINMDPNAILAEE